MPVEANREGVMLASKAFCSGAPSEWPGPRPCPTRSTAALLGAAASMLVADQVEQLRLRRLALLALLQHS